MQSLCFQLDGHLIAVKNLTLEESRKLEISATATNSWVVNGNLDTFPTGVYILALSFKVRF